MECARSAGELLLNESRRPQGPRGWGSHADADIEAETLINARLSRYFPSWGYLGEELGHLRESGDGGHLWLVDPNDATTAYLQGLRGPSVSIALLRDRKPVLGVVFAYAAPDDRGDLIHYAEGCGGVVRNGHAVSRRWPVESGSHTVVLLPVKRTPADVRRAEAQARPMTVRQTPSIAYRLALVAAGEADLTVSATSLKSWDFAAGQALVEAAGGEVRGARGAALEYAGSGHSETGGRLFGGSPALVREVAARWP